MKSFGFAYIAVFPFDMLVDGTSAPARSFLLRDHWIRVYWPFWNEESPGRPIPQVKIKKIPRPTGSSLYINAPLEIQPAVTPPAGCAFANALRIDIQGLGDNSQPARALANSFVSHARRLTNQWWLGHAHREGEEGYVRNRFAVDEHGQISDRSVHSEFAVLSRVGNERRLYERDFREACEALADEKPVSLYRELFLDAIYFFIEREDIRRSILETSVACDMAVYRNALRLGATIGRPNADIHSELSTHDLLKNVRKVLPRLFGSNLDFGKRSSSDLSNLVKLWSLRGAVAHGRLPDASGMTRIAMPTGAEYAQLMDSASRFLDWLDGAVPG